MWRRITSWLLCLNGPLDIGVQDVVVVAYGTVVERYGDLL
jgi:hypothetical protein